MRKDRNALLVAASLFCLFATVSGCASASAASPSGLVRLVYADHQPWAGKEIAWDEPAVASKYFDPSLAELIRKDSDSAAQRQEVPCLDGDPFLDAQDYDDAGITTPELRETASKSGVMIEVSFTGRSEAWKAWNVKLTYDVRETPAGWRVYDIIFRSGESLRSILACNASAPVE